MPIFTNSVVVDHPATAMYELVNDVRSYPQFLPWCSKSHILDEGDDHVKATLYLSKGPLKYSFTTYNALVPGEEIKLSFVEGPFKHLSGMWKFEPLDGNKSKISLHMDYEFSNKVLSFALGPVFDNITKTLIKSFVKRADKVNQS